VVSLPKAPLVIVLEDDESLRQAMRRVLEAGGYLTATFGCAEAVSADDAALARCLVLDVNLPGVSGLDFYAALGDTRPPAIFISADDGDTQRKAATRAGAFEFLGKPFEGTRLLQSVARATHGVSRS
jgi:FixJ family two-component response regulator